MKKIAIIIILSLLLSFGMSVLASAEEYNAMPRYANVDLCKCFFDIENDVANIRVNVYGISNVTSRITVYITMEKRVLLGLWWKEEASWTDSINNTNATFNFSNEVKSGTYRCNFEITIEGTGGNADVITNQITATN